MENPLLTKETEPVEELNIKLVNKLTQKANVKLSETS